MKIFKSIKWRLQFWYGLILVVVLAGFGVTAYQLERGRQFRRVDDELQRRLAILTDAVHRSRPPFEGPSDHPPGHPPGPPPDEMPPRQDLPPLKFELPPWASGLFGTNQPEQYFFVIKTRDGKELARVGNVPQMEVGEPDLSYFGEVNRIPDLTGPKPPPAFAWDNFREILGGDMHMGVDIFVGCSITPELKELHRTALQLFIVGGVILFIGLAGGWKIVSAAIRPIEKISATAVKISAGDLSQRIGIAETESELGQLAAVLNSTFARLETAFEQQKQFISDAAHELRTPVSVILTQTQTALSRERDAQGYRQTVEACGRAAVRMRKLIESLLELARFDAGQEVLKRQRFDFSKIISESMELVQPLAAERGVELAGEFTPLEITGDPERLAQVVTNLLTNAIHFNRPGGKVEARLRLADGVAILEISDTGAGITQEDLANIFKRFYCADKSRTTGRGAGLGLSICKAIVESHGGTIEASSEIGKGSTFTVRLPV